MHVLIAWLFALLTPALALAQSQARGRESWMPWSLLAGVGLLALFAVVAWFLSRRNPKRPVRF